MSKYLPKGTKVPKAVYFNRLPGHPHNSVGNIDEFNDEAAAFFAKGMWIVKDLIRGHLTAKRFDSVAEVNPKGLKGRFDMDVSFDIEQAWRDLWSDYYNAVHDSLKSFGVGALFSIGVGDGSANYRVTAVTKTKATVEWVGICCDDYYDHHFGGGGVFPRKDVERYCHFGPSSFGSERIGANQPRTWFELEKDGVVPMGMVPVEVLRLLKKEPVHAV